MNADERKVEVEQSRQSTSWISAKIALTSIFGYGILLSYTWPQGFLPIFSMQSIPAILLSFAAILVFLQLFLVWLFWPLRFLFSLRKNENPIRHWLYNIDPTEIDLPEEYADKRINIPIMELFSDLVATHGRAVFIFPALQAAIAYYFYWYGWSLFTKIVSPEDPVDYLPILLLLFLIYLANAKIIRAKDVRDTYLPLGFFFVMFIALPTLPKTWSIKEVEFTSNEFVAKTLRTSRLGGGAIVSVDPEITISGEKLGKVRLIFYDGNHAWVKPCTDDSIRVIEISPNSIVHYESKDCP